MAQDTDQPDVRQTARRSDVGLRRLRGGFIALDLSDETASSRHRSPDHARTQSTNPSSPKKASPAKLAALCSCLLASSQPEGRAPSQGQQLHRRAGAQPRNRLADRRYRRVTLDESGIWRDWRRAAGWRYSHRWSIRGSRRGGAFIPKPPPRWRRGRIRFPEQRAINRKHAVGDGGHVLPTAPPLLG